ncbi:Uncharacterised protein [Mycobacteroides abscessus subsp. massiliense]|nr:Uncharacterised protein [Mycobacteroides abscessus subsp. massiliense]
MGRTSAAALPAVERPSATAGNATELERRKVRLRIGSLPLEESGTFKKHYVPLRLGFAARERMPHSVQTSST